MSLIQGESRKAEVSPSSALGEDAPPPSKAGQLKQSAARAGTFESQERALTPEAAEPKTVGASPKGAGAGGQVGGGYANEEQYNRANPQNVAEFNRLTGYECADATRTWVVFAKVRSWQAAHGCLPDARIGPQTLAAARRQPAPPAPKASTMQDKLARVDEIVRELGADLVTTHGRIRGDARARMELWRAREEELEGLRTGFREVLDRNPLSRIPMIGPTTLGPEERLAWLGLQRASLPRTLRVSVIDPPFVHFRARIPSPAKGEEAIMNEYHARMRARTGVEDGPR